MLAQSGNFLTLHFRRRSLRAPLLLGRRESPGDQPLHPFSKLLLDQEIITETMAQTVSKQIDFLKERTMCWQGSVRIGPCSSGSIGPALTSATILSSDFNDLSLQATTSSRAGPVRFYCEANIFDDSLFPKDGLHELFDKTLQKAIAASVYIGRMSQRLLSGQQQPANPLDPGASTVESVGCDGSGDQGSGVGSSDGDPRTPRTGINWV